MGFPDSVQQQDISPTKAMATPTDMKKMATCEATGFDGLTSRNLWTSNFIQIPAAKTAHPNTCTNKINIINI